GLHRTSWRRRRDRARRERSPVTAASAAMAADTAMAGEPAMRDASMPGEPAMPMRKAVAPATVVEVAMIPAMAPAVRVSVVAVIKRAVTDGPVADRLRHASGHGK